MIKIYCPAHGDYRPMRIDKMTEDADGIIWGDICCADCTTVIITIEVEEEGEYEFRKICNGVLEER